METRNVTLSLPEPLLRKFKVYAATHNKSMSGLMAEAVEKMVGSEDDEYEKARKRLFALMKSKPLKLAPKGITWTRDELHER